MLCLLFSGKETPIAAPVTLSPASTSTAAVVVAAAEAEVITTASNNMVAADGRFVRRQNDVQQRTDVGIYRFHHHPADEDGFDPCIEDTDMDITTAMKTLQLSKKTITLGKIKSRHRFLIKKYHPDKNVNVSNDEEKIELAKMFREVHRAYYSLKKHYKHQQNDKREFIESLRLPYNNFCRRLSEKGTDLNLLENSSNERKRNQIEESNELPSATGDDICVICFEAFQDGERLKILPCNHAFHVGCIDRWLFGSYTAGCQTCKTTNTTAKTTTFNSSSSSSSTSKRPTKKMKVDHRRSSRLSGTSKFPGGVLNDKWLEKLIKE